MSGQFKISNQKKRSIREILSGDVESAPPKKRIKLCESEDTGPIETIGEKELKDALCDTTQRNSKEDEKVKKIFAVFVCGPDPTQCVEDPNAPNQRGQTYINLLKNENADSSEEEWKEYMIYRNEFPSKKELSSFRAIVITGSKHDAYTDDAEWKLELQAIILDIYENRPTLKVLGVCFGHQMIIHSLRYSEDKYVGRNTKRNKMELGLVSVDLTDTFHKYWQRFDMKVNAKSLRIHEAHQDVVFHLPSHLKDAAVMAHSQYTNVEMYHIGNNMLGVQGHPEFTTKYLMNAIEKNTKYMTKIYTTQELKDIVANMKDYEANTEEWKYIFAKWIRF